VQRSEFSLRERSERTRLSQLVRGARFLRGSLSLRKRSLRPSELPLRARRAACLYLVRPKAGTFRETFVPRQWGDRLRQAVENRKEIEDLIEGLSNLEWKRLRRREQ
jgi:hypothetical protein